MINILKVKRLITITATALVLPSVVGLFTIGTSMSIAQGTGADATKPAGKAQTQVHRAVGVVTRVVPELGVVMIAHQPVASLDWLAMNMTFAVDDGKLLDSMNEGDRVSFRFVKSGESYTIISID